MRVEFDPAKRTLEHRGLDFADAGGLFARPYLTRADDRRDHGEKRFVSIGRLGDVVVVVVWTPRGEARRIISTGMANEREKAAFEIAVA